VIFWLLYIVAEAVVHYYVIEVLKSRPDYLKAFIIRGMASIIHGAILDVNDWTEYATLLTFQVSSFWVIFDLTLNLARDKDPLYHGKDSGWIDRYLGGTLAYYILKVLALLVAFIAYFVGLKYWSI
jgi:hypothetical protein